MNYFMLLVVEIVSTALLLFNGYLFCLYFYRIFLHPLSKFPGPTTAAASRWYEFYYEVVLEGRFTFQIQKLHKQYGPIVRIAPDEIHIDDPEFFDTLFVKTAKTERFEHFQGRLGTSTSVHTAVSEDVHRMRRAPLNPFFSRRSIANYEYVLREKVLSLLRVFASYQASDQPLSVNLGYAALATDIIMQYCFGIDDKHIESPNFEVNFSEPFMAAGRSGHLGVQFPWIPKLMQQFPDDIIIRLQPVYQLLLKLQRDLRTRVQTTKRAVAENTLDYARPNVFAEIINSDLPTEEKSDFRLGEEAQTLVGAGIVTTGWTLTVATFHITKNRAIFEKLREELETALPHPATPLEWSKLEHLPYLTACLKEALRLSYGVTTRVPRLAPKPIQYGDWTIPPKTAVSLTIVDIHHNEDIFPDSHAYKPERWLDSPKTKNGESLDRFFLSFLRGNRSCLGINLAWAELYLTLAGVIRNFEFELFETDESDIKLKHDFFIPCPKLDSKGVRVKVKSCLVS